MHEANLRDLKLDPNTHGESHVRPSSAKVAVDHLNMLVGLVEEMTCKWERQLEDVGEGRWNDGMLAKEGTEGEREGVSGG